MPDIMEALNAAYDKVGGEETASEPVESAPVESAPPAAENTDVEAAAASPESEKTAAERARDDKGRFAAKNAAPRPNQAPAGATPSDASGAAVPPEAAPGAPPKPVAPAAPELKAPAAFKAAFREKWNTLPPDIQAELVRREGEQSRFAQETAPARKLAEEFKATVAPYEMMIRAEGGDPVRAVGSLLQTAAQLRIGTPQQKAQLFGEMYRSFGRDVPLEMLAQAIDGSPANTNGQQQPGQPSHIDPDAIARQVEERISRQFMQQRQQAALARGHQEVEAFLPKAEFMGEPGIRDAVADLMEGHARRGSPLPLEEAYNRVIWSDPELRKVLQQREAAQAAQNAQASTERAKAASVSIRTQPSGVASPAPRGILETMREVAAKRGL